MFEISSHVRNAGVTLGAGVQGVNGVNWNGYRKRLEIAHSSGQGPKWTYDAQATGRYEAPAAVDVPEIAQEQRPRKADRLVGQGRAA